MRAGVPTALLTAKEELLTLCLILAAVPYRVFDLESRSVQDGIANTVVAGAMYVRSALVI
jgi:hypothetical protein